MRKTIALCLLFVAAMLAQPVTPTTGAQITQGLPVNICFNAGSGNYGGYSSVWVHISYQNYQFNDVVDWYSATPVNCYAFTPSQTGNLYVVVAFMGYNPPTMNYLLYTIVPMTASSSMTMTVVSPPAEPDDYENGGADPNLALGMPATQSATNTRIPASVAVDGNTDGILADRSCTYIPSYPYPNPWWQVDLGAPAIIQSIDIWNSTDPPSDYWSTYLSDYWVFISNTPFQPTDDFTNLPSRPGTWSIHMTGVPSPSTSIEVGGYQGEYVRVQLSSGQPVLTLAEVQVWGTAGTSGGGSNTPALMQKTKTIRTSHGHLEIPRGDLVNVGNFRYAYSGSGPYTYAYTFDNRDAAVFRIGTDPSLGSVAHTEPKGWMGGDVGWAALKAPERSANSQYTLTSNRSPGVVPLFFQGDVYGIVARVNGQSPEHYGFPYLTKTRDGEAMAKAGGIFGNSLVRWAIGPVFEPGATRDHVLAIVKQWINQGFKFLQPLTEGHGLADLQPSNQLERDLVACLAAVLN